MKKNILLIFIAILTVSPWIRAQSKADTNIHIKLVEVMIANELYDFDSLVEEFENDSILFIAMSRSCNDTIHYTKIKIDSYLVNIWDANEVFFHVNSKSVCNILCIYDCSIDKSEACYYMSRLCEKRVLRIVNFKYDDSLKKWESSIEK